MATSYSALCTDFYINQKVALKMDVPTSRETVLDLFDRIRKELPGMERFRRFDGELSLESADQEAEYSWLALRRTSLRSGWVNPPSLGRAYKLHRLVLEVAPYFLSISPLDVEYVELVYGFDLEATTNRDAVVYEALLAESPLSGVFEPDREAVLDAQPFFGFSLCRSCELQAFVEVKTRMRAAEVASGRFDEEPISVYVTVRRYGSMRKIEDFGATFGALAGHIERLAEERIIPHVVMPIREAILSYPG